MATNAIRSVGRRPGYPVGDVRAPLTKFADLGAEGIARREKLVAIMAELDALMDRLDVKPRERRSAEAHRQPPERSSHPQIWPGWCECRSPSPACGER